MLQFVIYFLSETVNSVNFYNFKSYDVQRDIKQLVEGLEIIPYLFS